MARVKFYFILIIGLFVYPRSWSENAICSRYRFETTEYSFSSFNPAPSNVGGVSYPGNSQTLYRGAYETNPQFSLPKVLQALFYQKNWYMGSPMFFGIVQVLTGRWDLQHDFFPDGNLPYRMKDYFSARRILEDIDFLMSCQSQPYSQEQAEKYAADLMNKTFNRMRKDEVDNRYFNIDHPDYYNQRVQKIGFGNNAVDLIISTVYDRIAAMYGSKIVVMEDKRGRGLDLGYYNLTHNGRIFHSWVDNGEINSPGYVLAEEVIGYQQRKVDRHRAGWGQALVDNPIDFAVYRVTVENETFAIVLDAQDMPCITKGSDHRYYRCYNYWSKLTATVPSPYPVPSVNGGRVPLMGVISQCESTEACPHLTQLINSYGAYSNRQLDPSWVQKIENVSVNGSQLHYYSLVSNPPVQKKIKVISATFGTPEEIDAGLEGNVTEKAASFLDGKSEQEYKISSRFLSMRQPEIAREFEIQWTCNDASSRIKSKRVKAPAEGQRVAISCVEDQQ